MGGQGNSDEARNAENAAEARNAENAALLPEHSRLARLNVLLLQLLTSILCSLTLSFLVTAKQTRDIGGLKVEAQWKDSKALISLAVITAICLGYSAVKALLCCFMYFVNRALSWVKLLKWTVYVADQILAYGLLSVAAASAEVAYLAKNGQPSSGWSPVCVVFSGFCTRVGVSLILAFLTVVLLAINAFLSALALAQV